MEKKFPIPIPYFIWKGEESIIAWCPIIDVSTQGETIEEAQENMKDLVQCYFEDPDTPKPEVKLIMSAFLGTGSVPVKIPEGASFAKKTSTVTLP